MHPDSIFIRSPFGMGLGISYSLFVFKKHYTCQHRFGCVEAFIRKTVKAMTFWMVGKGLIELMSGVSLGDEVLKLVKDNCEKAGEYLNSQDTC